jgi:hypothetical protein
MPRSRAAEVQDDRMLEPLLKTSVSPGPGPPSTRPAGPRPPPPIARNALRAVRSRGSGSRCRGPGRYSTPPPCRAHRLRIKRHQLEHWVRHVGADGKAEFLGLGGSNRIVVRPRPGRELLGQRLRLIGRKPAACLSCAIALHPTSALISVSSSISEIGFCSTTFTSEAAGNWPSCGSIGPRTAWLDMTISLAANAISVPPDMA